MKKYNKYGAAHKNQTATNQLLMEAGMTDLQMISCFYKNEGNDGIGLCTFESKGAQMLLDTCVNMHNYAMGMIKSGALTLEQYKSDLLEQLTTELIPTLKSDIDKDSDEYIKANILTYCDIYALEQLGVIQSDEYNGMNYAYSKGNVLAV
jgi:hypothetical protein